MVRGCLGRKFCKRGRLSGQVEATEGNSVARYWLLDTARHTWSRSCMQHYWIICSHSSHCRATPPAVSSFQAQSSSTPVQPQFSVINWTLGLSESLQSLCWPEGLTAGRRGSRGPSGRSTDHHNQCRQQKPKHDQLSAHCRLICTAGEGSTSLPKCGVPSSPEHALCMFS